MGDEVAQGRLWQVLMRQAESQARLGKTVVGLDFVSTQTPVSISVGFPDYGDWKLIHKL